MDQETMLIMAAIAAPIIIMTIIFAVLAMQSRKNKSN